MGRKLIDIMGQKFGDWTVLTFIGKLPNKHGNYWKCVCKCGAIRIVNGSELKRKKSTGCGCSQKEKLLKIRTTHNHSYSKTYTSWHSMIQRCTNSNMPNYYLYGGRDIIICNRWLESFENFLEDMGERPVGKTLDRYPDKNGNYEPNNCRWATYKEQSRNTKTNRFITYNGKTQCIMDWALELNIGYQTLLKRFQSGGWSIEEALTTPPLNCGPKTSHKLLFRNLEIL
jgi:hypothetical protein